MSGESWAVFGLTLAGKVGLRVSFNFIVPGLSALVEFGEAVKNLCDGNYANALISIASGTLDIWSAGLWSAAKNSMQESGSKAFIQAAQKRATKMVGKKLAKDLATGVVTTPGKAAAIETAKATADFTPKEAATLGKYLAKGLSNEAFERVFYDSTKSTFENWVRSGFFSMISSGGQNVVKTVTTDIVQEFAEKALTDFLKEGTKQSAKSFPHESVRRAVWKAAKEEFRKYDTKKFTLDINIEARPIQRR